MREADFTNEETETQKFSDSSQGHMASKWLNLGLEPSSNSLSL